MYPLACSVFFVLFLPFFLVKILSVFIEKGLLLTYKIADGALRGKNLSTNSYLLSLTLIQLYNTGIYTLFGPQ